MENAFSLHIKELRTQMGMNQAEFSKFISTNQSTLSAYENNERFPPYETLVEISIKCNVSLDWLCGLDNSRYVNRRYDSYKDMFRVILELLNIRYSTTNKVILSYKSSLELCNTLSFVADDVNFNKFFAEWEKMRLLYDAKTIDEELYKLWIEKELMKYDFPISGLPECFS